MILLKSIWSVVSRSMDRKSKFVSLFSVMVDRRYVEISFIFENERSQPATETAIVNICSPTFRSGNTSPWLNETACRRCQLGCRWIFFQGWAIEILGAKPLKADDIGSRSKEQRGLYMYPLRGWSDFDWKAIVFNLRLEFFVLSYIS